MTVLEFENRKRWFKDRIGKRVFRNNTNCCEHCKFVYENGIIITDNFYAGYLFDIETEFTMDGYTTRYFDTREEMLEFENQLERQK